tara:strand:- start:59974 stop:60498 length:525 start_codon:yes stop_codon:yes gene_type:complete
MKTRQLAKLLETIVRKVVREEFKSLLNESKNAQPKVKQPKFDPLDVSHILEHSAEHGVNTNGLGQLPPTRNKTLEFSKDTMVNQMLTETYESNEWRNINGSGNFTSQQAQGFNRGAMAEMLGYNSGTPTVNNMTPTVDPDGRPMDVNLEGTKVGEALTRDYSSLMKKINAKKGK